MKRIEYIDALRGFAIFLMVVGHVIPNLYLNKQMVLPNLNLWIYSFHMPLFFTISGYFIMIIRNSPFRYIICAQT